MSENLDVEKRIAKLNVIDDTLFQKMAEDKEFCEEMLSTILSQKVSVLRVIPQNSVKNLQGRSVVLDAYCQLENVPDVIGIFISKFDVFKGKKAIYHVERKIRETGEINDNGLYEIYVNTKVDDGTDVAQLMKIFKEQEIYDFVKFPKVSKRKQHFLKGKGGKKEMCEIVEEYARQCVQEAEIEKEKEIATNFLKNGVDYEMVRKSMTLLSDEELRRIYENILVA